MLYCAFINFQITFLQKINKILIGVAFSPNLKANLFEAVRLANVFDAELVAGILEEMRRLAEEGMTMIVVTHEIGFARKVGDRLLFMDQGVVVEEGIPQEVLNNPQHPETQAFLSSMIWE